MFERKIALLSSLHVAVAVAAFLVLIAILCHPADRRVCFRNYFISNLQRRLLPKKPNQVVFIGDSITEIWKFKTWFKEKNYINRGICSQITAEMLARFNTDVLALKPDVVVILGGTNDIYENVPLDNIKSNIAEMTELAMASHIKVILGSVTPICGGRISTRPPATILALDDWIKDFANSVQAIYADYFSVLVDSQGLLQERLAEDCLHLSDEGYALIAPLVEDAIAQAFEQLKPIVIVS